MIEQLRKERSQLNREMDEVRNYIRTHPNKDRYQGSRAKLYLLLNAMACAELKLREKIIAYEEEERLSEIYSDLLKRTADPAAKGILKYMDELQLIKTSR